MIDYATPRARTILPNKKVFLAPALVLLAIALSRMSEKYDAMALSLVTGATLLIITSLFFEGEHESWNWLVRLAILATLVFSLFRLPLIDLYLNFPQVRALTGPFVWMACAAIGLVAALAILRQEQFAGPIFLVLVLVHALMAFNFLAMSNDPYIDVYVIEKLGAEALLHGHNPYAITFPNIYWAGADYYPKDLIVNGVVQCGYFYLPLSLLLVLPGYLAGDVRFTHLITLSLAALLIGFSQKGYRAKLIGALVLFLPNVFHILENAWLEPDMILLLAAIIFARSKRLPSPVSLVLFGFLLSVKQYTILAAPLVVLLGENRKEILRGAMIAGATMLIVNLPFFLWNPRAFLHSTIALYAGLLRTDSISISAWLMLKLQIKLPMLATAGVGLVASSLIAVVRPRSFAVAIAVTMLCIFLFSTQAFVNYYYFATAALAISLLELPVELNAAKSATLQPQAVQSST